MANFQWDSSNSFRDYIPELDIFMPEHGLKGKFAVWLYGSDFKNATTTNPPRIIVKTKLDV